MTASIECYAKKSKALQKSQMKTSAFLLTAVILASSAAQADPIRDAAKDVVQCRGLGDSDVRLACFEAAADALDKALKASASAAGTDQRAANNKPRLTESPANSETVENPEPGKESDRPRNNQVIPPATRAGESATPTASSRRQPAEEPREAPGWAAPPLRKESDDRDDPNRFEATIVRITRNNAGRHRFYTEQGAIWEQTQIEEIRPPRSLPTMAEFRKRLTGNPTIKFDISNQAYRVRRVE